MGISPETDGRIPNHSQPSCGNGPCKSKRFLRIRGGAIAIACWALVVTAAMLDPQPWGYGTHEQLGLPPCSRLARSGYPCPACGLTTSVSASAHGRVVAAVRAQPFGLVIFVAAVLLGLASTAEVVSGRDILSRLRPRWWWLAVAVAALLGGWRVGIALGVASGIYPTH